MSVMIRSPVEDSVKEGSLRSSSIADVAQDNSRHIHFHMHLGHTIVQSSSVDMMKLSTEHPQCGQSCVTLAAVEQHPVIARHALSSIHGQQQHTSQSLLPPAFSPAPQPQQGIQKQHLQPDMTAGKAHHTDPDVVSPHQQPSRASRRSRQRLKAVVRAVLLSGAATAAVLAGAGAAVVILSPRVEQLEVRCLEMQQQNQQLAEHTTSLAAAKQQLEQQLSNLSDAKAELDRQVVALTAQQGGLLLHNQELADKIKALHTSQQQLQLVAEQMHAQVEEANGKLAQQQQQQDLQETAGAGSTPSPAATAATGAPTELPVAPSGVAPRPGDLSVQVTIPGFTDALVSRVGQADLVPQFATALVAQVKQSNLVGNAVDVLLGKLGQQVAGVLCPWKWGISLPWQQKAAAAADSS